VIEIKPVVSLGNQASGLLVCQALEPESSGIKPTCPIFHEMLSVGCMVRIKHDLYKDARYQVLKIKTDKVKIVHEPTGDMGWIDRHNAIAVDLTVDQYREQVANKLRGGDY
jgi:hypothetical protein